MPVEMAFMEESDAESGREVRVYGALPAGSLSSSRDFYVGKVLQYC
jgi:hypothetical protein